MSAGPSTLSRQSFTRFALLALISLSGCAKGGEVLSFFGLTSSTPSAYTPDNSQNSSWNSVEVGGNFSCALSSGKLYCFGENASGQLGNGSTSDSAIPVQVLNLPQGTIQGYSVGSSSHGGNSNTGTACAIVDGSVYCWGSGGNGQLGNGQANDLSTPSLVTKNWSGSAVKVVVGWNQACIISSLGEVWCWGYIGSNLSVNQVVPVKVNLPYPAISISVWGSRTWAKLSDGSLWLWEGNSSYYYSSPTSIATPGGVQIAGLTGSCILTYPGSVFCYNFGVWTQTTGFSNVIAGLSSKDGNMACALLVDGSVNCFGNGSALGSASNSSITPNQVPGLSGASQISAANDHACALVGQSIYCWGENNTGQLGNTALTRSNIPVLISNAVTTPIPTPTPIPVSGNIGTWTSVPSANAPTGRWFHSTIWTGNEMIVWGGYGGVPANNLGDGARFNLSTNSWTATATTNAPAPRSHHSVVWTGSKMIVWGGCQTQWWNNCVADGGIYDPMTDSWTLISPPMGSAPRADHTAIWTGSEMILWSGVFFSGGIKFNPALNSWQSISSLNAPTNRQQHSAVWTGSKMIVWGGFIGGGPGISGEGAIYDPISDSWSPLSNLNAPTPRYGHSAIWTGSKMIIWGGGNNGALNDGGVYDPASDTWTTITTNNAPDRRYQAASYTIWTGSKMVVWGGYGNGELGSGGIFDPVQNTWSAINSDGAPSPRVLHSVIWSGTKMIVWGGSSSGQGSGTFFNDGGIFSP